MITDELLVVVRANTAQATAALSGLQAHTAAVSKTMSARMMSAGTAMAGLGRSMSTKVTLPVVGAGIAILKTAGNFQQGMNQVRALTGATGGQFDKLEDQAKELGRTTQFSASQAADAMGFLGRAGFDAEQVLGAMPGTLELAAAAQMDLGRTANIVSNVLTSYGMDASELGKVNDSLVKGFTSTNMDLSMLGESFEHIGPVAKSAGVDFNELVASIGMLGNAGIQGSMAGTSLKNVISRMLAPTGEAADLISDLGLNVTDGSGNFIGFTSLVDQLGKSGATTGQMMELFGQRAGPAMAALVEQGSDAIADLTAKLDDSAGTAKAIADVQMEGLNGAMRALKSAAEGLMIAIAESGLLDMFTNLAKRAVEWVQGLTQLNPGVLKLATGIALAAAAGGPALIMFGKIVRLVGLVAGMNPILLILAAVIGGIAYAAKQAGIGLDDVRYAFAVVMDFLQPVIDAFRDLFGALVEAFGGSVDAGAGFNSLLDALTPLVVPLTQARDFLVGLIGALTNIIREGDVARTVFDTITRTLNNVRTALQPLFDLLTKAGKSLAATASDGKKLTKWFNQLMNVLKPVYKIVADILGTVIGVVMEFVDMFVDNFDNISAFVVEWARALQAPFARLWRALVRFLTNAWDAIEQIIMGAVAIIRGIFTAFFALVTGDWGRFWEGIKIIISGVQQILAGLIDAVFTLLRFAWDAGIAVLQAAWETFWAILGDAIKAIRDGIVGTITGFWGWITDTWNAAIEAVQRAWDNFWNNLYAGVDAIRDAVGSAVRALWEAITGLWNDYVTAVRDTWTGFWDNLRAGIDAIREGVRAAVEAVWGAITEAWNTAIGFVRQAWDDYWANLTNNFETIKATLSNAISTIWSALRGAWDRGIGFVQDAWDRFWNGLKDGVKAIWGGLWGIIQGLFNGVMGLVENGINKVIDGVNSLIDKINKIPTVNIGKIGSVTLPRLEGAAPGLATGGLVTQSGVFRVGERGPELLHLPAGSAVTPGPAPMMGPQTIILQVGDEEFTRFVLDRTGLGDMRRRQRMVA